jgi:phosphohistidine phosphatase
MDLILWRHAEAEDGNNDLERELTSKGQKQAARIAKWLLHRLPARFTLVSSPAARQTAQALGISVKTDKALAPGASISAILQAAGWPDHKGTVVMVGHQPDFGRVAAYLVGGSRSGLSIKKAGLWWLNNRVRGGEARVVVRAVVSPDLL